MDQYQVRLYHVRHGSRKRGKTWGATGLKTAQQIGAEMSFDSPEKAEALVRQHDLIDGWSGAQCRDKSHYIATVTAPDGTVSQWENGENVGTHDK